MTEIIPDEMRPMLRECRLEFQDIVESLAKLEDVPDRQDKLMDTLTDFRIEVKSELASLKTKSGIWGLLGGLVPVIMAMAYMLLHE